ncbi:MAG: T9SS type A sorting domain-containing protein, partial [Saprospiraceae bacterium]
GVNLPVVEVQGSYIVQQTATNLGNNDAFQNVNFTDPISVEAETKNDGYAGLFPLNRPNALDSSPWDWWDVSNVNNANGLATNPDMSAAKARTFIDTIVGFFAPRACYALNLACDGLNKTKDLDQASVGMEINPNPAGDFAIIQTRAEFPIEQITVYNGNGSQMMDIQNIHANQYKLNRGALTPGIYFVKARFKGGILTQRVIFN